MHKIQFFEPVIYQEAESIPQKILETIDEYFYLGNKFRVRIFNPDAEHPNGYAMHDRRERHRSFLNLALKVISYATIIIPLNALIVKAALRSYLQIPSIPFNTRSFASQSQIETRVPPDATKHCVSFLSYKDQGQFAQVALFARDNVRGLQQRYIDWTAPFKEKISNLPLTSPNIEVFRQLIIAMIISPAVGHPHYWHPLMDDLLERFLPQEIIVENLDKIIECHTQIAHSLAASETLISPDQLYHFCKYLQTNQLTKFEAWSWVGYIVLEQYMAMQGLDSASVKRVLQEYLKRHAETYIRASSTSTNVLRFKEINIDPRVWFGISGVNNSLLKPKTEGEGHSMPELLLEVLWTRIESLRTADSDMPFIVAMQGRSEAPLPENYTLELAKRITNADIFLESNDTVDRTLLDKPEYADDVYGLSREARQALIQRYPKASVVPL